MSEATETKPAVKDAVETVCTYQKLRVLPWHHHPFSALWPGTRAMSSHQCDQARWIWIEDPWSGGVAVSLPTFKHLCSHKHWWYKQPARQGWHPVLPYPRRSFRAQCCGPVLSPFARLSTLSSSLPFLYVYLHPQRPMESCSCQLAMIGGLPEILGPVSPFKLLHDPALCEVLLLLLTLVCDPSPFCSSDQFFLSYW